MEKFFRPVVLFTIKDEIGKGSARSIPGLDLFEALVACADCLENFGGHARAAGLTIKAENLANFQKSFENVVNKMTTPEDWEPKNTIDHELNFDDISQDLIDEIESLMPFGIGNLEPLFMVRNLKVVSSKIVGENHRRMVLKQLTSRTDRSVNAIHFNVDPQVALKETFDQIAFRLRWNRWNGKKTAQIVVEDA